jgi:hypothetical protein
MKAGHYAMVMYDHGEPEAKEMTQNLLAKGRANLVLRTDDHFALPAVALTESMRQFLKGCDEVRPSPFGDFVEAIADTKEALQSAVTYRAMGIEPNALSTVTLCVCAPPRRQASEFSVSPLSAVQ